MSRKLIMVKLLDKKWKWVVIVILLPVFIFLAIFLYQYFFYTCCALPPGSGPASGKNDDPILNDPDLLYAKKSFIGFCRTKSGDGGSCRFSTYLYKSGEYILESSESVISEEAGAEKTITHPTTRRELSEGAMDGIFSKIRDSGIMEKTCEAEMVLDYYVDYFINLDGIQKEIRFPGCEPEFNAIDGLIDAAVN